MLWVVVLSACYSMYQYFRAFYHSSNGRRDEAASAATPVERPLPGKKPKVSVS